jgi:methionyl-tRNA formyltransferase
VYVQRVLVVGDNIGIPRLLRHLDAALVCGIVAAEIRPQYLDELAQLAVTRALSLVIQPRRTSPRFEDFVQYVAGIAPDLIVCDSYSMLLPPAILTIPRAGAVNVHSGLLPEYRGSNPIQWAIINGESEAGVTIHYMDGGFDTGDIIARRRVEVRFTDTWLDVRDRIAEATESLMAEQMPLILDGQASRHPQDSSKARQNPRRRPEDGRIDWHLPVRDIYNLIRALVNPLPGAHYDAGGQTHVVDRYLTIAEVAALKHALIQDKRPERQRCEIRVVQAVSNDPIDFAVVDENGRDLGRAELTAIDYANGRAVASIDLVADTCDRSAVVDAVTQYATSELALPATQLARV